ncbi:MAG TPA: molybdate ABC transporter substrate-binding protein [Candidatus Acidoferrales bacterium]|nr:molybdate ABC transporter substrate-binding protein [Candidatus Acidoferrales bacterium]
MASNARIRPLRNARITLLLLGFLLSAPLAAGSAEIVVAAASDLTFAFKDLAPRFEKRTGDTVKFSYGSSGNFFAQIQNGAPYDAFFSADIEYPKKLERAGLIEPGTIYEYAVGKIVLWVPGASTLDLKRGPAVMLDPAIRKIAIANPDHAPYGRAAVAAMRHEGIYDRLKDKLVLGENISQTAEFVLSGNADIGVLALSLVLAPAMKSAGRYVDVPLEDYPAIVQAGVTLKSSRQKEAARQFFDFIRQPASVALMRQYGFTTPEEAGSKPSAETAH